jgi:serine/threonine protein phosphatase 1
MFSRLFSRFTPPKPLSTTGGRLVYAVGDVHGRLDLLQPLIADILTDARASASPGGERPLLVLLGDYIDRGPESAAVLDLILGLADEPAVELCALKGNHEEAMMNFLYDPEYGPAWMQHGGGPTMASYGVTPPMSRSEPEIWAEASQALLEAVPAAHRSFLSDLALSRVVGDYAFVHAGVRPGAPLRDQTERDLLWIRYDFLDSTGPFEKVIVHGHTPTEEPQLLSHRLGVDTGAYATGILTAVRLQGEDRSLIQAKVRRPQPA